MENAQIHDIVLFIETARPKLCYSFSFFSLLPDYITPKRPSPGRIYPSSFPSAFISWRLWGTQSLEFILFFLFPGLVPNLFSFPFVTSMGGKKNRCRGAMGPNEGKIDWISYSTLPVAVTHFIFFIFLFFNANDSSAILVTMACLFISYSLENETRAPLLRQPFLSNSSTHFFALSELAKRVEMNNQLGCGCRQKAAEGNYIGD